MKPAAILMLTAALFASPAGASSGEVTIEGTSVFVGGKAFPVRGAAGNGPLDELAALGATTVRTYGEDPGPKLDAAHAAGLKVIAGLWVGHPRQGADYNDNAFIERQLTELEGIVEKYKDHSALLMWGIGNEVEVDLDDDSPVWPQIEAVAQMVKRVDPAHPTLGVIAESGQDKVRRLTAAAPSIDVLGINSYGDALYTAPERARKQGWEGPIVITELGAVGQWQAAKTPWGAPFEPTSTQKAIQYRRYLAALNEANAGSIMFLWGQKQEVTPTWHSLRMPDGAWTEASEAMAEAWGGRTPDDNKAPRIVVFRFAHDPSAPFASWNADMPGGVQLEALDPDEDPLEVTWSVMAESTARSVGGDPEAAPQAFPEGLGHTGPTGARIESLPAGHYRIFVEVRDPHGAAASANLPFELR